MKGSSRQRVEKVTITENGVTWECNAPSTMERVLVMEGMRRFSQTNREPPMNPKVTKAMSFWGQKPVVQKILRGEFDMSTVQDKSLCDLIKKLQTANAILKLGEETTQITPMEQHTEWKTQKVGKHGYGIQRPQDHCPPQKLIQVGWIIKAIPLPGWICSGRLWEYC